MGVTWGFGNPTVPTRHRNPKLGQLCSAHTGPTTVLCSAPGPDMFRDMVMGEAGQVRGCMELGRQRAGPWWLLKLTGGVCTGGSHRAWVGVAVTRNQETPARHEEGGKAGGACEAAGKHSSCPVSPSTHMPGDSWCVPTWLGQISPAWLGPCPGDVAPVSLVSGPRGRAGLTHSSSWCAPPLHMAGRLSAPPTPSSCPR